MFGCVTLVVSIVLWFVLVLVFHGRIEFSFATVQQIPSAITINGILWVVFIKWLWRYRIFYGWLVPFPDLSGEWVGRIKPTQQDAVPGPIDATIQIRQNFLNISVKMITDEMISTSYSATLNIDAEQNVMQLCYSYISRPTINIRDRSAIHYGTTLFEIMGVPPSNLQGEYWTSRKTTGELDFRRITT